MSKDGSHTVAHVTVVHSSVDNRIARKECVALKEANVDVCLVAVRNSTESVEGVPIHRLPNRQGRLKRMMLGSFDAWKALKTIRPSVIHIHDPELIPMALLWRLRGDRRVIYDAHEDLPKQIMSKSYIPKSTRRAVARLAHGLEAMADRGCDVIIAATPSIARNFRNSNVVLVQNFPWIRDFPPPVDDQTSSEARLAYVGAITRERCGFEMIQAAVASAHKPRLVLAGPVTHEMRMEIDRRCDPKIDYLGVLPAATVPKIVGSSSLGLVLFRPLPNHLESQPTKIYEYMAAARPFIASNFAYWITQLGHLRCGVFVDPNDLAAIVAAVDTILNDPIESRRMGLRGREAFEKFFNFDREATGLISAVLKLLDDVVESNHVSEELMQ